METVDPYQGEAVYTTLTPPNESFCQECQFWYMGAPDRHHSSCSKYKAASEKE